LHFVDSPFNRWPVVAQKVAGRLYISAKALSMLCDNLHKRAAIIGGTELNFGVGGHGGSVKELIKLLPLFLTDWLHQSCALSS
jgi:hypothetical protein